MLDELQYKALELMLERKYTVSVKEALKTMNTIEKIKGKQ